MVGRKEALEIARAQGDLIPIGALEARSSPALLLAGSCVRRRQIKELIHAGNRSCAGRPWESPGRKIHSLSARGRRRLHFDPLTRSRAGTQLRHSLNGVETVCALLAAQPPEATEPLVTAWLTEMMAIDTLHRIYPDAIVALQGATGSALLCLEIDESTKRSPVIRDKLARYETALWSRIWDVVFVVGSTERASRLAAIGRAAPIRAGLAGKAWALVLPDLRAKGLAAPLVALNPSVSRTTVGGLLVNPAPRRCPTPVGSEAWLRLLGSGGVEDHAEALR